MDSGGSTRRRSKWNGEGWFSFLLSHRKAAGSPSNTLYNRQTGRSTSGAASRPTGPGPVHSPVCPACSSKSNSSSSSAGGSEISERCVSFTSFGLEPYDVRHVFKPSSFLVSASARGVPVSLSPLWRCSVLCTLQPPTQHTHTHIVFYTPTFHRTREKEREIAAVDARVRLVCNCARTRSRPAG